MRHNHKTVDEVIIENRTSNGDTYDTNPVEELLNGLRSNQETTTQAGEDSQIHF
jgi:hypothetical protein